MLIDWVTLITVVNADNINVDAHNIHGKWSPGKGIISGYNIKKITSSLFS